MSVSKSVPIAAIAIGILLTLGSSARAVEPRPWLCRDKPVFSSDQPMTYEASPDGGGRWVIEFMRFDLASGHDGFTVYDSRSIAGPTTGSLESGQWYAVGMYNEGGHWICAPRAQENHHFVEGVVRQYCYGESEGGCDVKLIVRESKPGARHN